MPTSAIGNRKEAGFTLIELLVVLAIMAMMLTVVMLVIPQNQNPLTLEADKLAARIAVIRDQAISSAQEVIVVPGSADLPLPKDVAVEPAKPVISFDGTGIANADQRIWLIRGKERAAIEISMSGDVRARR